MRKGISSMNQVQLVGRLTKDPSVRYTDGGNSIARFTVACDRRFKKEGQPDADFISCTAFGKTAEFVEKYFNKGQRIGLTGRIQTGSYDDSDGKKVYTTDVVVESVEFVESKGSSSLSDTPVPASDDGFISTNAIEEELPFNS